MTMEWIEPMEPILRPDAVSGHQWVHQVKWDGVRILCQVEDGKLRLFTRNRRERTGFYPELEEVAWLLQAKSAWLDGEMVVFDKNQKPSFYHALVRERLGDPARVPLYLRQNPARYIVFDIMALDGKDLRDHPLRQRKAILEERLAPGRNVAVTQDFPDGEALLALMVQKGWEGIVSKQAESPYVGGKRHRYWYKTKLQRKLLSVVCGLSMKGGVPASLLLGIRPGNEWVYIGKASLGLTQEHFRLLKENMGFLAAETPPFPMAAGAKDIVWFRPVLTCWVSFLEWTNDGSLRHPRILGFSTSSPDEADGTEYVE
ncbi:MAG TPA: non-homologous end-joining DNA ligase [Thermoclostridium sp.]|nr:non-homologous end-joining DNA ligase [Thermoclostridium sp.]